MAKVTQEQRSSGSPQLKPTMAGGADLIAVTIAKVDFKTSQFRKEKQPVLIFEEFPDAEYRCGKRATDRLCEKLGEETDWWVGETIPLVKGREEVGNNVYVVYQVPPPDEWKDALKRAGTSKTSKKK